MNEIAINDIKPLVEVPDASLYFFIILIIFALIIFVGLLFLLFHVLKNRKKNERKLNYKILQEVDLSQTKKASYTITHYARFLARNPREEKLAKDLIEQLDKYKYKKDVDSFDKETLAKFHIFMDELDV